MEKGANVLSETTPPAVQERYDVIFARQERKIVNFKKPSKTERRVFRL